MNTTFFIETVILCLIAAASPGPNFFMTTANTMEYGKKAGIMTALGVALGVTIWLFVCGLGLGVLISKFTWLNFILQISASIFLFYIGFKILKNCNKIISQTSNIDKKDSVSFFTKGFIGTVLNGGVGVFYGAIFAKVIAEYGSDISEILFHGLVFNLIELFWFLLVAIFVSSVRKFVEKYTKYINISLGILMIYFGFGFLNKLF